MAATSNAAKAGGEAGLLAGALSGAVKSLALVKAAGEAASAASEASNAANGVKLSKQLASQAQMGETGETIAGAGSKVKFRDAPRIAKEHGGDPSDWEKKSSSSYTAKDGAKFETHWVENVKTGERVEFKTKLGE